MKMKSLIRVKVLKNAAVFTFAFLCVLTIMTADSFGRQSSGLKILTSFLPVYIFTKNIVGNRTAVHVEILMPADVSPHDYHMRPSDMMKVEEADYVIINGLGLEDFMRDALAKHRSRGTLLESSRGLPLIKAGEDRHGHEHEGEFNPHTWVSPKMALLQVDNIKEFLIRIDPAGEREYIANARRYKDELESIYRELTEIVQNLPEKRIVTYHNAFDYLARDTGMEIAAVVYSTPEENPSAAEVASLIEMMKERRIRTVFTEPQFSGRLIQTIARETGAGVYVLDPVATGNAEIDYYEKAMRRNIRTLREASKY